MLLGKNANERDYLSVAVCLNTSPRLSTRCLMMLSQNVIQKEDIE